MNGADLLREVGEALYGPRWQSDLARAIAVGGRTMRWWATGERQVPSEKWTDIGRLIDARGKALADLKRRLPR